MSNISALTKLTRNGRVTIPARLRRFVGIEPGDYIEVTVQGDGLLLMSKKLIDKSQATSRTEEERNVGAHDKTLKDA
jgi:AbrB family looped-hinge helix DNA binding protein